MSGADWFTYDNLVAGGLARAADVNTRMAAIQTAFGLLPAPAALRENRLGYVVDTGTANALIVAMPTLALSAYTAGLELSVNVLVENTGASTIDVDGVGAKTILRADGSALQSGDLGAGQVVKLVYDGTNFRLLGASETAAAASATAAAASAAAAAASATAAANSATASATSATNSADSAADAAASATAAADSAADAALAVTGYAALAGATFTGAVTVLAPASDFHAATKKYVDDAIFASGSAYTADVATITLTGAEFGLTPIADDRVLGNVSGASAKPTALTPTQLTALIEAATTALPGAMSAADKSKLDAITGTNTGDQTNITGNAATATKLATARTIGISGAVTGTATSFDGSSNITIPITALNVGSATAGTLAVARGGTGVTTSTGTGNNVLSASPALTGTPTAPTASSGTNTTQIATTAFVQAAVSGYATTADLADKADAFLATSSFSANKTLADSDNNELLTFTSATNRTLTLNSTPSTGFSCIIHHTGSATLNLSCAGGMYVDGAASSSTSASSTQGDCFTCIHKGGGVWIVKGLA